MTDVRILDRHHGLLQCFADVELPANEVGALRGLNLRAHMSSYDMNCSLKQAGIMRRGRFGGAHLLDAVVEDGVIIHYETVRSSLSSCDQSTPLGAPDEALCRT